MKRLKLVFGKLGLAMTACGLWMAKRGISDQCAVISDQEEKGNRSYGSNRSYSSGMKKVEELVSEAGVDWSIPTERPVTAVMYGGALDGHHLPGVMVNEALLLILKDFNTGVSYAYERMELWKDGKAMYRFSSIVGKDMRKWMLDSVEKEGES